MNIEEKAVTRFLNGMAKVSKQTQGLGFSFGESHKQPIGSIYLGGISEGLVEKVLASVAKGDNVKVHVCVGNNSLDIPRKVYHYVLPTINLNEKPLKQGINFAYVCFGKVLVSNLNVTTDKNIKN